MALSSFPLSHIMVYSFSSDFEYLRPVFVWYVLPNLAQQSVDSSNSGISPKYAYSHISKQGFDHPARMPFLSAWLIMSSKLGTSSLSKTIQGIRCCAWALHNSRVRATRLYVVLAVSTWMTMRRLYSGRMLSRVQRPRCRPLTHRPEQHRMKHRRPKQKSTGCTTSCGCISGCVQDIPKPGKPWKIKKNRGFFPLTRGGHFGIIYIASARSGRFSNPYRWRTKAPAGNLWATGERKRNLEKYSSGRRGAPAKGVDRVSGAGVQIPPSPFKRKENENNLKKLLTSAFRFDIISNALARNESTRKTREPW